MWLVGDVACWEEKELWLLVGVKLQCPSQALLATATWAQEPAAASTVLPGDAWKLRFRPCTSGRGITPFFPSPGDLGANPV